MTLAKGNHVIKLDLEGNPLTTDRESYIEFEVEELTPHFGHIREYRDEAKEGGVGADRETYVVALLRKIK